MCEFVITFLEPGPEFNRTVDFSRILHHPQGVPGAVNITVAEFRRLQSGGYLNDTLIEFGFKHVLLCINIYYLLISNFRWWLFGLTESNPEVASGIHVFSSFFFKKLNDEGYESVRRWTSRLDLFNKTFVIVPINEEQVLHP